MLNQIGKVNEFLKHWRSRFEQKSVLFLAPQLFLYDFIAGFCFYEPDYIGIIFAIP